MTNSIPGFAYLTDEERRAAEEVMNAIPEDDKNEPRDMFVSSLGVVLKLKPVPPMLMADIRSNLKEPKPPLVPNTDKDPDNPPLEENPADPEFQSAMRDYHQRVSEMTYAVFLTRGTSLVTVPDGVEPPDSTDWSDEISEFTGMEIPKVGKRRYYAWLKYVALTNMEDFGRLLSKVANFAGITSEVDVAQAAESFRSDSQGDTSDGVHTPEGDRLGNTDQAVAARDGAGVRVQGNGSVRRVDLAPMELRPDSFGTS